MSFGVCNRNLAGSKHILKIEIKIVIAMILVIKIEMMMIKLVMAAKGGERGSFEGLPRRLPLLEAVTFNP